MAVADCKRLKNTSQVSFEMMFDKICAWVCLSVRPSVTAHTSLFIPRRLLTFTVYCYISSQSRKLKASGGALFSSLFLCADWGRTLSCTRKKENLSLQVSCRQWMSNWDRLTLVRVGSFLFAEKKAALQLLMSGFGTFPTFNLERVFHSHETLER